MGSKVFESLWLIWQKYNGSFVNSKAYRNHSLRVVTSFSILQYYFTYKYLLHYDLEYGLCSFDDIVQ